MFVKTVFVSGNKFAAKRFSRTHSTYNYSTLTLTFIFAAEYIIRDQSNGHMRKLSRVYSHSKTIYII